MGDEHDRTSTRSLEVLRPGGLLVQETFPLERAGAARARGEARRTRGKLVLSVAG